MQHERHRATSVGLIAVAAVAALLLSGCGKSATAGSDSGKLRVVAAENFWASIAAQLGGEKVQLTSMITNPATDPHSYQPNTSDARTIANAGIVLINGTGYDEWARQCSQPMSARGSCSTSASCSSSPMAPTRTSGTPPPTSIV